MQLSLVEMLDILTPWIQIGVLCLLVWKTGVVEGITNKILRMTGTTAIGKGVTETVRLSLQETTTLSFLDKYNWLIKPLMTMLSGHFGGDDIEFMKFIANEGSKYNMPPKQIVLTAVNHEDLDAIEANLNATLKVVTEKRLELAALNKVDTPAEPVPAKETAPVTVAPEVPVKATA